MATVEDYAVLSAYVYGGASRLQLPSGWTPLFKADGSALELSAKSGYYGAVFQNQVTGEVALISRGASLIDGGDRRAGQALLDGRVPWDQLEDAQSLLDHALKMGIPPDSISFGGHSLGGSLAQLLSALNGKPAVTFNAVPVKRVLPALGLDPEGSYPITDVVDSSDIIGNSGPAVGTRVTLPSSNFPFSLAPVPAPGDPDGAAGAALAITAIYF